VFDPETARLLRSAPPIPNLSAEDIPSLLTRQYARLVSARLRGSESYRRQPWKERWTLEELADTYEIITSVTDNDEHRKSSAFVSATAQQILSKEQSSIAEKDILSRNHIDSSLSAALLFLISEQYADASEAAKVIATGNSQISKRVSALIKRLASGEVTQIYENTSDSVFEPSASLSTEEQANFYLYDAIAVSIEMLCAEVLSRPTKNRTVADASNSLEVINLVENLASGQSLIGDKAERHIGIYSGPRHLASLLKTAAKSVLNGSLTNIEPPQGSNTSFWKKWIDFRAEKFPFVWPNHREAISNGFLEQGNSAVMVLPTGAGKTTVSSLKIAGVLARGKKVIFLAPTHALVDQLTTDLQEMFPEELLNSIVSSDFDQLLLADSSIKDIEVMTPERCLAMMSYAPEAFEEAGLLVFDECHLLDGSSGKTRRALDSMFCVLNFAKIVPSADLLFMSAMLKNGENFSEWISELTKRNCLYVEIMWKPSRQARGVVYFDEDRIDQVKNMARAKQLKLDEEAGKPAKTLRSAVKKLLKARPKAVWGLQHNWLSAAKGSGSVTRTNLLSRNVQLAGNWRSKIVSLTPNANELAAEIAKSAYFARLKTIIFVNNKQHAVSTARKINEAITNDGFTSSKLRNRLWSALEADLGSLDHSLVADKAIAVPHHASMFPLERRLSELMFRSAKGAGIIVATPTIAQGLNLPADLVIIAGDKRAVAGGGLNSRKNLEAHEILNAAGRAGRAGHVANGVVLLIHDKVITFDSNTKKPNKTLLASLQSILPEDDRCISIEDPLTQILDKISTGDLSDSNVVYLLNRTQNLSQGTTEDSGTFRLDFNQSFGAYIAKKLKQNDRYQKKIEAFAKITTKADDEAVSSETLAIAAQSALPTFVVTSLVKRLKNDEISVPKNLGEWLDWTVAWFKSDSEAYGELFEEFIEDINKMVTGKKSLVIDASNLGKLLPALKLWVDGHPINEIENSLGGDLSKKSDCDCPRSRFVINKLVPRALSYTLNLISQTVEVIGVFEGREDVDIELISNMGTLVRKGYNSNLLLQFSVSEKSILSRVQMHCAFKEAMSF